MFSNRSYEWWEAGNRLNTGSGTHKDASSETAGIVVKIPPNNFDSTYEDSKHRLPCEEYQHPFEDDFSQEVFYED